MKLYDLVVVLNLLCIYFDQRFLNNFVYMYINIRRSENVKNKKKFALCECRT